MLTLGDGGLSDAIASEECDRLVERYASLSSDEVQCDEVDRTCWLDVDVGDKLVAVDDLRSVIRLITYNQEVGHTSSCLNVSHVRIAVVFEQCSCDFVVQFEQRGAGDLSNLSFDHEEEPSNVDAIECGAVSQSCLVSPEYGTLTLIGDDRIDSSGIEVISLEFGGRIRKFSNVPDLSSGKSSEITSIPLESILSSPIRVRVPYSGETRQLWLTAPHSIASTLEGSSS
jgi:hypothetical protein